jgi:hypothetical protein
MLAYILRKSLTDDNLDDRYLLCLYHQLGYPKAGLSGTSRGLNYLIDSSETGVQSRAPELDHEPRTLRRC